jgi:hypothetical protein
MPRGKAEFKTQKPISTEPDTNVSPVVDASNRYIPDIREMNPSGSYETLLDVLADRTEVGIAVKELEEDYVVDRNYYEDLTVKELDDDLIVNKGESFLDTLEQKSPLESLAGVAIRGKFRAGRLEKVKDSIVGYEEPEQQKRPKELRPRAGDLSVKELDESMVVEKGGASVDALAKVAAAGGLLGGSVGSLASEDHPGSEDKRSIIGAGAATGALAGAVGFDLGSRIADKLVKAGVPLSKAKYAAGGLAAGSALLGSGLVSREVAASRKSVDDDMVIFKGEPFLDQVEDKGMNINRKITTQQRRTQNKVNNIAKPTPPKPPSIKRPTPNKPTTPTVTKPSPPSGTQTRGTARFVVGKGIESRFTGAISGLARGAITGGLVGGTAAAAASDTDRAASFVRGAIAGATVGAATSGAIGAARPELYEMAMQGGLAKRTIADTVENMVPVIAATGAGVKSSTSPKRLVREESEKQLIPKSVDESMIVEKNYFSRMGKYLKYKDKIKNAGKGSVRRHKIETPVPGAPDPNLKSRLDLYKQAADDMGIEAARRGEVGRASKARTAINQAKYTDDPAADYYRDLRDIYDDDADWILTRFDMSKTGFKGLDDDMFISKGPSFLEDVEEKGAGFNLLVQSIRNVDAAEDAARMTPEEKVAFIDALVAEGKFDEAQALLETKGFADDMVTFKGGSFLDTVETKYRSILSGAKQATGKARTIVTSLPKGKMRGGPSIPKPTGKRPGATATKENPAGAGIPNQPVADANKSQAIINQEKRMAAQNQISQAKGQTREAQSILDELDKAEKAQVAGARQPMSKWTKRLIGAGAIGGGGLIYAGTGSSASQAPRPQYYTRGLDKNFITKSFKRR